MTTDELRELRAWAAEVCGYKSFRGHEYHRPKGDGWEYVKVSDWLPDQNIAQAFEVVDAIGERLFSGRFTFELGCDDQTRGWWANMHGHNATHDDRCTVILLACRKAWPTAKHQV